MGPLAAMIGAWMQKLNQLHVSPHGRPRSGFVTVLLLSDDRHDVVFSKTRCMSTEVQESSSFSTTHWSVVLAAGRFHGGTAAPEGSASTGAKALERLCACYWYPLYAFIRRQNYSPHDAQDLTQEFFSWLLDRKDLRLADPERGRFRSFLLVRLKHFLSDQAKRDRAQKRGGGQPLVSLDVVAAEEHYQLEVPVELAPEKIFDRSWAIAVLDQTVARLRREYLEANRAELFEALKQFQSVPDQLDPASNRTSYAEVAQRLNLSEGAVKSAIWRLRQRHRELLREEITRTVATPADVDEEIRYLVRILSS